jgi:uncharacterized protein (DUF1015 family)
MVGVHPFVGSYVKPAFVRRVPAPAFDSMSGSERTNYLETHPESYTLVTRSPGDGGPEDESSGDRLIAMGGEALQRILRSQAFVDLDTPSFFLYRLTLDDHVQLGVVGQVETSGYLDGRVKRHEQISLERATHLSNHFEQLGVHSSPIALGYRSDPAIRARLDTILDRSDPVLSFTSGDGLEQAVWVVDDEQDCAALTSAFADHDLYIMDGHHRAAAAGELAKRVGSPRGDYMLGVLFADDRVNIDPFHRRVRIAPDQDLAVLEQELIELLGLLPEPELETRLPHNSGQIGVYLAGRWWYGSLPAVLSDSPLDAIDPVRLQRQVIGPVLGIDPATSAGQISYFLEANRGTVVESADERTILFILRSVTPAEVFAVADAGLDMPPKSTYVTPKPRSGVFLRRF